MASTSFETAAHSEKPPYKGSPLFDKSQAGDVLPKGPLEVDENLRYSPDDGNSLKPVYDSTHRKLKPRHIQLIGIGGYRKP